MSKVPMRFAQEPGKLKKSQCVDCIFRQNMLNNMDSRCAKFGKCPDKYRLISKNTQCPKRLSNKMQDL